MIFSALQSHRSFFLKGKIRQISIFDFQLVDRNIKNMISDLYIWVENITQKIGFKFKTLATMKS